MGALENLYVNRQKENPSAEAQTLLSPTLCCLFSSGAVKGVLQLVIIRKTIKTIRLVQNL